jgi:hypothetical protein
MRLSLAFVLVWVLAAVFASCAQPQEPTLEVTPTGTTLVSGQGVQLVVTRRFSGDIAREISSRVEYASSDMTLASVDAHGVVTAQDKRGNVLVRVHDPGTDATTTATFSIVPAQVQSIDISPSAVALAKGQKRQLTATARLTNGAVKDVTAQVLWTATNELAATVGNTAMDKGLVLAVADGETDILGTDSETQVAGRALVFVTGGATAQVLVAIEVDPNPGVVPVGKTAQFTARGVFSDGSTQDLTREVTWRSSRADFATIDPTGVATGVAAGDTTITATGPEPTTSVLGSAALKVTP